MKVPSQDCPRFEGCNAPLCPLDPDWQRRRHLDSEPICGLAMEAVKDGATRRLREYVRGEVLAQVYAVLPDLISRSYGIRQALKRASKSGSRLDNLRRAA